MSLSITGAVQSVLNQATTQAEWAASFVSEFGTGCKLIWYQGSTPRVTLTFSGSLTQVGDTVEIGPTYAAQTQSAGTPDRTVLESSDGSKTAEFSTMLTLTGTPGSSKGFTLDGAVVIDAPAYLTAGGAAPIVVPLASITLTGRAPGIADLSAPEWGTIPTITFAQGTGGSVNVTDLFNNEPSGTTYTHTSGTLPTGVTFEDGVYTYDGSAAAAGTDSHVVTATTPASAIVMPIGSITVTGLVPSVASVSSSGLPEFSIVSSAGGTNQPFTFGHVFAQGDVPTGNFITSDLTDWQAEPTTYWPDGSVRHAIISGRATTVTDTPLAITLGTTTSAPGGTDLTETDLASALPTTTLVCGAETITLGNLVGTAAKHRTVASGPVMSNWLYRKQLTGSNHLVAWFDVRLYLGGAVEVFPWVENGYLFVASPTNDSRTYTFTIGGSEKFSATLDIKHHTRVALINNTSTGYKHWSYWSITEPEIEPLHDSDYLMASKMVPKYAGTPDSNALAGVGAGGTDAFAQTFAPNWLGNTPAAMGNAGYSPHIGILPQWAAVYCASGDVRPYRAVVANGLAAGSWPMHYRDESTDEPIAFSDWPNISVDWSGSPTIPTGSGGVNSSAIPDRSHQPSLSFLPWLLTGRWFHLEEQLLWLTWSYAYKSNYSARQGAKFLLADGQTRAAAWVMRTMAQVLAILPSSHPCQADVQYAWEQNMAYFEGAGITGTELSGSFVNNLGWIRLYSSSGNSLYGDIGGAGAWWDAAWMQSIFGMALGIAWDMDVPQSSGSKTSHDALRDHVMKIPVGFAGDGSAGTYNYRRFGNYAAPIGTDATGQPPETWYADYGDVYDTFEAYGGDGGAALNALPGGTAIYYGNTVTGESEWGTTSGLLFQIPPLAMAVDQGVTGAAAGWGRLTASSSWSTALATWNKRPMWGIVPRTV